MRRHLQEVSDISDQQHRPSSTTAEERIAQLQEALQRRFRAAGHGSIQRVEAALGLCCGYFKDQRRPDRRRIDLRVLLQALGELEVRPADFFADALGSVDPLSVFLSQAAALGRKGRLPRILELERRRSGGQAGGADLSELDALRLTNPKLVLRRACALVRRLDGDRVPELLGICASALRLLDRLDEAQIVLARALELVAEKGTPRSDAARSRVSTLRGDLLLRASHVAAGRGDYQGAVALSEKAALAFVAAADLAGVGKALVDQGIFLGRLGHLRRAIRVFERALDPYLPAASERSDVRRHRLFCLANLGAYHRELGELEDARRYAAQAANAVVGSNRLVERLRRERDAAAAARGC